MFLRSSRLLYLTALLVCVSAAGQNADDEKLPAEVLREFSQVYATIRNHYVDEVDDDVLLRNAIRGMVDGLDPHSSYLSEEYLSTFNRSLEGLYGGVGLYIDADRGLIRVVAPIDNTPADRAGLRTNDFIISIDGESTEDMPVSDAVNLMRGLAGTPVTLSIVRLSEDEREDFETVLEREEINSPSVRSALAPSGYGFIRISQFLRGNRTSKELAEHIDGLYQQNGSDLKGLIIDLRNNPGGDLFASICVASVFLKQGLPVVTDRGRNEINNEHNSDLQNCQTPANVGKSRLLDIAILVNQGSASASEIVAGALQDNERGIIVGTNTFGKASVQRIYNLEATDYKSAVKLTSARYYTPSGRSIHNIGIAPDIEVEYIPVEDNSQEVDRDNDNITADELSNLQTIEAKNSDFLPVLDNQYQTALEALRAS